MNNIELLRQVGLGDIASNIPIPKNATFIVV